VNWRTAAGALGVGLIGALAVTLVFAAQMAANGTGSSWIATIVPNALHWGIWAVFAPALLLVTRRAPIGVGHRLGRPLLWVALGIIFSLSQSALAVLISWTFGWPVLGVYATGPTSLGPLLRTKMISYFAFNMLTFAVIAGTLHAILYYRDLRIRQLEHADLQTRVARAELGLLRMQLQPHFLFNTLHTASALMERDVLGARRVLAALGDLLRLSIAQMAHPEVCLREELEFLARYVAIQHERFRDRLAVHVEATEDLLDALVPSLLLQPLVENAIRHGIEPYTRAGHVWICATRDGDCLALTVHDDGPPVATSTRLPSSGMGLTNLSARLQRLYGSAHEFHAARDPDGVFRVSIRLPYHTNTT
jgi:two-component system LytT family sensor kinase